MDKKENLLEISDDEIAKINQKLMDLTDERDKSISGFYAGCNYYINRGNNEVEPTGTATSMHDCDGCEKIDFCTVKMPTLVWRHNDIIEKDINQKFNNLFN